jgi:hypothetical protein
MEQLYKEMQERLKYLEAQEQTEEIKWRFAEITLAIVRVQQLLLANVSGRSELLFAFIAEVKKEFADQNWDYLDFIAERVLKANNSH